MTQAGTRAGTQAGTSAGQTSGAEPILTPDVNFGANMVGWYLPENEGATYVDASSAGNDLTRNGSPTVGSDSDGDYILHDAATKYYGTAAFAGIADGAQPWILCVAKQSSAGAMIFGTLSDDGLDAGGLDASCPDATDIAATTQAEIGASPVSDTYRYMHGLDTTALNLYGFGYWHAELVMVTNGDIKPVCVASLPGVRGGTSTNQTVINAQDNFRLGGNFTGDTHETRIYETIVLAEAPTGAELRQLFRYLANKYPSLAANLRVTQSGGGIMVIAGQSNVVYLASGDVDGGTTVAQDGSNYLWGRLYNAPRPDAIRWSAVGQGSAGIGGAWIDTSMLRTEVSDLCTAAGASESVTILWLVGEADGATVPLAEAFQANFEAMMADMATESGRDDIQHILIKLHSDANPTGIPELATVRSQMDALAAANSNVTLIDLEVDYSVVVKSPFEADLVHYWNSVGRQIYARGCSKALGIYGASTWNIVTHSLESSFGFRLRMCIEPTADTVTESGTVSKLKQQTFWGDWYTQGSAASQPTWNASGGVNNLPYLSYPDASTVMSARSHIGAGNNCSQITLCRMTTGGAVQIVSGGAGVVRWIGKSAAARFTGKLNLTGGTQDPTVTTPALDATDRIWCQLVYAASRPELRTDISGVITETTNSYTGSADTAASPGTTSTIGHASAAIPNARFQGEYVIDGLTAAEFENILVPYINSRYGTSYTVG